MANVIHNPGTIGSGMFTRPIRVERPGRDPSFSEVLRSRLEKETGLNFSAHAMDRLNSRGITLSPAAIERLSFAVERAGGKGASDSLVILDDAAFIVSVENRTVVTVMDRESMRDMVFTNIDSAVIA